MQNPVHSYASAGSYQVCLITSDGQYMDTLCQSVTVANPVSPSVSILILPWPNHQPCHQGPRLHDAGYLLGVF
ncbi:MAG: hypothetical protein R3B47_13240 [Bacteroidia bacterium]